MGDLTLEQLDAARRDPVVFSRVILGEPLWDHQLEVATSQARYRVLCAGRRAGKTRVFGVLALHRMFAVPGSRVLLVSAGRTSVVRTHKEIAGMARGPVSGTSIEDDQVMTLTLSNGSVLESVTQSVNAVRSADVDLLIIDEAGFVEQSVWESAEPTIGARPGSRVLVASSPWRGPGHFFHDLWRQGMEAPDAEVSSWHWPSTVSPFVDAHWLEGVRERNAPDYFAREYLAEWTGATGSYFDSDEIDAVTVDEPLLDPGEPGALAGVGSVSGGVDWGMQRDAHALVVVAALPEPDERGRTRYAVRFIEERYRTSYEAWIERLVELGGRGGFAFARLCSETNGVGQMSTQVLARRLWEDTGRDVVEPLSTTAKLKQDLFGFARLLIQQKRLLLPRHPSLLQQLRALEFETTDSGVMRIAVPDRIGHDDVAMAFAMALQPLMAGELVPVPEARVVTMEDILEDDLTTGLEAYQQFRDSHLDSQMFGFPSLTDWRLP
ncbi:terminase family protein [Nocardioides sp. SOB44]|uniref:Terminase family protein n=1 Tax=Nocardioides cremeus TaxID=3058044 RepID=A0ABT8TSS7_9ACTN|nr:terminase family protein [Nocardioides cremeus]MDO3397000.1 terminase family protein [Nocardioides cremeus]